MQKKDRNIQTFQYHWKVWKYSNFSISLKSLREVWQITTLFCIFFVKPSLSKKKLSFGGEKGLPDVCQISLGHIRNQIFCNLMEPKDLLRLFTNPNHTISYNTSLSCPILLRFSVCLSHKRKVEFGQKLPCTLCDTISVNIYVPGVDM